MRWNTVSDAEAQIRLRYSISGLEQKVPDLSAKKVVTKTQRLVIIGFFVLFILGLFLSLHGTLITMTATITVVYATVLVNRVYLFAKSGDPRLVEQVSDDEARAYPEALLPIYTVLVPAYQEPEVIHLLLEHLGHLEYPPDRLDIKVLLEADDQLTIEATRGAQLGDHFEVILVPPADPRTKPKALNYGLSFARGDLVTIYDAEDDPDPLQLRRAAIALARLGPEVACLQAKLSYRNVGQNIITKWFTLEYAMWFSLFLPGLVSVKAPLPLGGTSNHFRRSVLESLGAWDPNNVTEDADLGVRLYREGYVVKVLESVTYEEANSDFVNWVRQRSRWYKGYLQTWLLHMRSPGELRREVGTRGMVQFNLFVGGTPILALLNPIFWLMTIVWFAGHTPLIKAIFPAPVFYLGLICFSLGNFLIAYLSIVTCQIIRRPELLWAALLVPVYWVMMSIAAYKGCWQLIAAPTFWEKTVHGLQADPDEPAGASGKPQGVRST